MIYQAFFQNRHLKTFGKLVILNDFSYMADREKLQDLTNTHFNIRSVLEASMDFFIN